MILRVGVVLIKQFEVTGLPAEKSAPISHVLHDDLNILTGRNGSGKTTLLKLLWYIISGNIEHAVREVPFSSAHIETSEYSITVRRQGEATQIDLVVGERKIEF